jgi:hypothetical protein
MLHRTRALLIRQQTMLANAFRAHLAEFGIVVAQGMRHVRAKPHSGDRLQPPAFLACPMPGAGHPKAPTVSFKFVQLSSTGGSTC